MNKCLVAVFACLGLVLPARADPPPEPSVASMPNPGHWIRQRSESETRSQSERNTAPVKAKEISTETWLVGSNRFDLVTLDDQTRRERFVADGICYESGDGKGGTYILDPRIDAAVKLPSSKDWQEFGWVRPELFKGEGTVAGYKCNVYEEQGADGLRRAMIEQTTRLPMALEEKGVKYIYKYLTPSSQLPKRDDAVSSAQDNYKAKLKSMTVDRKPK